MKNNNLNYLLDTELLIAIEIIYRKRTQNIFEIKPKDKPYLISFIDSCFFRKNLPIINIPWKIIGTKIKIDNEWLESKKSDLDDLDSYCSILEYWKSRVKDIDEALFSSHNFVIQIDSSEEFRNKTEIILKEYVKKLVSQELEITENEVLFDRQFEAITSYVNKLIGLHGLNEVSITENDVNIELKKTSSFFKEENLKIRLIEIMLALQFAEAIEIKKCDFVLNENNLYVLKVIFDIKNTTNFSIQKICEALNIELFEKKNFSIDKSNYSYDKVNKKFKVTDIVTGESGEIYFRKAKTLAKIFETFLSLWEKDKSGNYSKKEVQEKYEELFDGTYDDLSSNASKIIKEANREGFVKKLLIIKGSHSRQSSWEFKILDTATTPPNGFGSDK